MCKKFQHFFSILLFIFFSLGKIHSQVINNSQLLKQDNWIYKALEKLSLETQTFIFSDTKPISVGELKFYLSEIKASKNFEKLSSYGKVLYNKIEKYLYTTKYLGKNTDSKIFPKNSATRFYTELKLNPEFYVRTNKDIPSSIKYFYKDWPLTLPLFFGISENVALQLDLLYGKNYESSVSGEAFTNIPLKDGEREYEYPKFAYGSFGNSFSNWGFSATLAKESFSIGNTKLGSIIYNSTFETDGYSVLSAYSSNFKYNLIFSQVDYQKYLYLHNFNIKLFPNFKISITEGCLRNGPIELRFFNPTMILHSFYAASFYSKENGEKYNLGNHYSSYLGITVDFMPIKNLRLYSLVAVTEFQLPDEITSAKGKMVPNGYGIQIGADFLLPTKNKNSFLLNYEAIYTSPYLYIKHSPAWSMINFRNDFKHSNNVISWLGSPFGPDTFAFSSSIEYEKTKKMKISFQNLFTMKGEIQGKTLLETNSPKTPLEDSDENSDKTLYPAYYPLVAYNLGLLTEDEAIAKAQTQGLTGTIQYKNDFILSGDFYITAKITVSGEAIYTLIFNSNHIKNDFQQGFEFKLSFSFNVF